MNDEFWNAIGALVTSPFICVILLLIIGAIAVISAVDRGPRKK